TVENFNATTLGRLYEKKSLDIDEVISENPDFSPFPNSFYILKSDNSSGLAFYNVANQTLDHVEKRSVYGIKPRNAEQAFAIHAVLNPDIKLVSLTGVAGTGKTLIALAASLEQRRDFKQVYLARPIVPLSNRDLGYLPGDAKEKINPYMQPLWDNLKLIKNTFSDRDKEYKQLDEMVEKEKIVITPLAYIRGRSLANIIFIVDESQNLTPHEVKTIITRAGDGAKFIFTGDVKQIDSPYLDEQSNGLSYLVDRVKGHDMYAHITLEKGERSALANLANDLL
ncbi:PhoH family protein, partial [Schleiferiaceae bacterium]|nr:PhoH family protein [Schleiferiaceae bacterium]